MISKAKKGFFLINEIIIVLVISAIVGSLITVMLSNYFTRKKSEANQLLLEKIQQNIVAYYDFHGFLPCPADLTVSINDIKKAGQSQKCSVRNTASYGDVVMGGIPFQELGISERYFHNTWNNKIVYVVPRKLTTDRQTFNDFIASPVREIVISDLNQEKLTEDVAFLLLNPNQSNNGVYKKDSKNPSKCTSDNCRLNKNFIDLGNNNLSWISYKELSMVDNQNLANPVIDQIWYNQYQPPNDPGLYLIVYNNNPTYIESKPVPNYSLLSVDFASHKINNQASEKKYKVLKILREDDVFFHKQAGNFVLTKYGLNYLGNFKDFNQSTININGFINDLSMQKDGLFILNRYDQNHFNQIEGLDNVLHFYPMVKKIDGMNILTSKVFHHQTVFDQEHSILYKYDANQLQWVDWLTIQNSNTKNVNNWCGGRECNVSGVRKCGPLMPGRFDRDIYGRFVVRDMLIDFNSYAVNGRKFFYQPNDYYFPMNNDPKHHGLYFSYWNLDQFVPHFPSLQHTPSKDHFKSHEKRFLINLASDNKWYKYINLTDGIYEGDDIKDFVTQGGIYPFELCKEGVGVFATYEGIVLDPSHDQQPPFFAVFDEHSAGVVVVHDIDLSEQKNACCGISRKFKHLDNAVSLAIYLGVNRLPDNYTSNSLICFIRRNKFLYHNNQSIGQLNPLLGFTANHPLKINIKDNNNKDASFYLSGNNYDYDSRDSMPYSSFFSGYKFDQIRAKIEDNNFKAVKDMLLNDGKIFKLGDNHHLPGSIYFKGCRILPELKHDYKMKMRKLKLNFYDKKIPSVERELLMFLSPYYNTFSNLPMFRGYFVWNKLKAFSMGNDAHQVACARYKDKRTPAIQYWIPSEDFLCEKYPHLTWEILDNYFYRGDKREQYGINFGPIYHVKK